MKSKLAYLILFAAGIALTQFCYAGQTKYAPIVQEHRSTASRLVVERHEGAVNFIISGKSMSGSALVSGNDTDP